MHRDKSRRHFLSTKSSTPVVFGVFSLMLLTLLFWTGQGRALTTSSSGLKDAHSAFLNNEGQLNYTTCGTVAEMLRNKFGSWLRTQTLGKGLSARSQQDIYRERLPIYRDVTGDSQVKGKTGQFAIVGHEEYEVFAYSYGLLKDIYEISCIRKENLGSNQCKGLIDDFIELNDRFKNQIKQARLRSSGDRVKWGESPYLIETFRTFADRHSQLLQLNPTVDFLFTELSDYLQRMLVFHGELDNYLQVLCPVNYSKAVPKDQRLD